MLAAVHAAGCPIAHIPVQKLRTRCSRATIACTPSGVRGPLRNWRNSSDCRRPNVSRKSPRFAGLFGSFHMLSPRCCGSDSSVRLRSCFPLRNHFDCVSARAVQRWWRAMEATYVFGSCRYSYPFEHRHFDCPCHGCVSLEVLIKRNSRYERSARSTRLTSLRRPSTAAESPRSRACPASYR